MYGAKFRALEQIANAAGLNVEATLISGVFSITLSDGLGCHMQRFSGVTEKPIEKIHEDLYMEIVSAFFGEDSSIEENAPDVSNGNVSEEKEAVMQEAKQREDVAEVADMASAESVQYGPSGFALSEEETQPEDAIVTPERAENASKEVAVAESVTMPEAEAEVHPADEEGSDFEVQVRLFASEKDRHFSALIKNAGTREKIKKLMEISVRDPKAVETQVKGKAYLEKHGIVL